MRIHQINFNIDCYIENFRKVENNETMQDDVKEIAKMQRAMINGISAMKGELLGEITGLRKDMEKGFGEVNEKIDKVNTNLTARINYLGKQLNALDEDAPTGEDFKNLEKRVGKLEKYQNFATS